VTVGRLDGAKNMALRLPFTRTFVGVGVVTFEEAKTFYAGRR
jgi:hypothetical protein